MLINLSTIKHGAHIVYINNLWHIILDTLFPLYCAGCERIGSPLCETCVAAIPRYDLACLGCSARNATGAFCASCKTHARYLDRVLWATSYDDTIIHNAITQFKYKGISPLAQPLASLMVTFLERIVKEQQLKIPPHAVIAVLPLHPQKLRERGFNQSALLARFLSHHLSLPLVPELVLTRNKNTQPQAHQSNRNERRNNMNHVFVAQKNTRYLSGKTVLLVDDIATTGSTLNDAARALKEAGASRVWGIVVARGG